MKRHESVKNDLILTFSRMLKDAIPVAGKQAEFSLDNTKVNYLMVADQEKNLVHLLVKCLIYLIFQLLPD